MKRNVKCFFLTPIDLGEELLRRFAFSKDNPCSGKYGYHNASIFIGEVNHGNSVGDDDFSHDDPRWPKTCNCGYEFKDDDEWQHNIRQLHERSDGGTITTLGNAPPGAMWNADWHELHRGPDGRCLIVRLPTGVDWMVDGSSTGGGGWTRNGEPPTITVRPSIWVDKGGERDWHGFLIDGNLEEC